MPRTISVDALFTLTMYATRLGPGERFWQEIVEAANAYPHVVAELLYETKREAHGWPA